MQTASRVLTHGRSELAKVIVGQEEMITQCLLAILCQGHALLEGVPGIAKTLVISRKTVEHHLEHIYNKIGVTCRTSAVVYAVQHGIA